MKCAIMQPDYFPWAGYFNLMTRVDYFVFFDDVQFRSRYWQQRNRILLEGKDKFITVPVQSKGKGRQLIKDVLIDDSQPWRQKHKRTILNCYAKHPYLNEVISIIQPLDDFYLTSLSDLTITIIKNVASGLGLTCTFIQSSQMEAAGKRSDYLFNICNILGCDEYLSPVGAAQYLTEDGIFDNSPVKLEFQDYKLMPYTQIGAKEFISHLSVIDILANLGWEKALEYIKQGKVSA